MVLVQNGSRSSFDELYEKYKNDAVRTAYLITGNQSICEDIAQETFVTCYRSIGSLKNPKAFTAWFYHILTRIAWKYGKLASIEIADENVIEKADEINVDTSIANHELTETKRILCSEISGLEPNQKTVVILYYYNELTTREIAQVLKCSEGTVKSRLHTARKKLRERLDTPEYNEKESETCAGKQAI